MSTTDVRSFSLVRPLLAGFFRVTALVSLVGIAVPTAHADTVDNNFLAALKSKGVDFASGQSAIIAGHEVCDEHDLGRQASDVATEVTNNSSLDGYHRWVFCRRQHCCVLPEARRIDLAAPERAIEIPARTIEQRLSRRTIGDNETIVEHCDRTRCCGRGTNTDQR